MMLYSKHPCHLLRSGEISAAATVGIVMMYVMLFLIMKSGDVLSRCHSRNHDAASLRAYAISRGQMRDIKSLQSRGIMMLTHSPETTGEMS
jgi:hypothetical protein